MRFKTDLGVKIAGMVMKNPFMPASGTFGYGEEVVRIKSAGLPLPGAIIVKGTTLEPRDGNAQPRIIETASGMLNSIGLENPGVEAVIRSVLPFLRVFRIPIIINIAGFTMKEWFLLAKRLDGVASVSALEVNISCPNVEGNKLPWGLDPKVAGKVVRTVRKATSLPLIVKLTPNVTDIVSIALAVEEAGASAISLINTVMGAVITNGKIKRGGISGPAIKPIALDKVYQVCQAVKMPVIGGGGIETLRDVLDFMGAGATAVQIGTAIFRNPHVIPELEMGLKVYCRENKIRNLSEIRGTVKPF